MAHYILRYVYISYCSENQDVAEELTRKLRRDHMPVRTGIRIYEPGTSDWHQAARNAISSAFAVIVVVSPHTRHSEQVQQELTLALEVSCPLYPLWIEGEEWAECTPSEILNHAYVDCRKQKYYPGINQTLSTMMTLLMDEKIPRHFTVEKTRKFFYVPTAHVQIDYPGIDEHIFVNFQQYTSREECLAEIYSTYLQDKCPPDSYGSQWCLVKKVRSPDYFIADLPASALTGRGHAVNTLGHSRSLSGASPRRWYDSLTYTLIDDFSDPPMCVVATNNSIVDYILMQVRVHVLEDILRKQQDIGYFGLNTALVTEIEEADLEEYSHVYVLMLRSEKLISQIAGKLVIIT